MKSPEVSVVMGVFNGGERLPRTLDSVLQQVGVDLEFIIVDDGSTDETPSILRDYASRDSRVIVINQQNAGLTAALICGCAAARGEFIARQDAGGDTSVARRLQVQLSAVRSANNIVLNTCGTRFLGPEDEFLFDTVMTTAELEKGLRTLSLPGYKGPTSHPACVFRRSAYQKVGGYRRAYTVAQDTDLWLRLAEAGEVSAVPDVLYQASWTIGGLSARFRDEQLRFALAALSAAQCRREGRSQPEDPVPLDRRLRQQRWSRHSDRAAFHYFIGSCIAPRDARGARKHFWKATLAMPFNWRSWARFIQSLFRVE